MSTFIEDLFKSYNNTFYRFYHISEVKDLELIAFTHGILFILTALKIDPKEVLLTNSNLKDNIDLILDKFDRSELSKDKLYDFIHDKDDVNIRKYVPGGTE